MSNNLKGVRPISERKGPGTGEFTFSPKNRLDVPKAVQAHLKKQGMDYRWLDAKQMADQGNIHKNDWEIFKINPEQNKELKLPGVAADGTIRSGTCILGVRSLEVTKGHKEYLAKRRKIYSQAVKSGTKQFREEAMKSGSYSEDTTEVGTEVILRPQDEND